LISALGPDAFGLLTLAWSCIGYFSSWTWDSGRALAQLTAADRRGRRRRAKIPARFWTSLHLMALVGALARWFWFPWPGWFANYAPSISLRAPGRRPPEPLFDRSINPRCNRERRTARIPWKRTSGFRAVSAVRIGMGLLDLLERRLVLLPYSRRVTTFVAALLLTPRLSAVAAPLRAFRRHDARTLHSARGRSTWRMPAACCGSRRLYDASATS